MRKGILVAGILVLLLTSSTVMAGDIDGIWINPNLGLSAAVMVRENGGTVYAIQASLAQYGEQFDYCVLAGTQEGNTIILQNMSFCPVDIILIMTLTSPTTAAVIVDSCAPRLVPFCIFPSGASFTMVKAF